MKSSWQYLHERLGLWDQNADEFQRLFRAGRIDYAEFCRRDAALWKGIPKEHVLGIIDEIPYHEGVRETIETLTAEGVLTVVLSTGLSFLVEKVKRELALTLAFANELVLEGGVLTGETRIHVEHDGAGPASTTHRGGSCGEGGNLELFSAARRPFLSQPPRTKGYWVRRILNERGIAKEEAAAVGDGDGDRGMFDETGVAIGYHPSPTILPLLDHSLYNGSFKAVLEVLRAHG